MSRNLKTDRKKQLLASLLTLGPVVLCYQSGFTYASAASSELISQQSSVVAQNVRADAAVCATGTTPGTIGHSIAQAMRIHTEIASATPNTESLFEVDNDCFSGLSQIVDLSFSIPSLSSILSAAQDALLRYAQKQVCTAVGEISGMVTSPLNQAIAQVNTINTYTDLDSMANDAVSEQLYLLDPDLGNEYHAPPPATTYTVNPNPFNTTQTNFTETNPTNNYNNSINNTNSQINAINTQMANVQAQIGPMQTTLQTAQQSLQNCLSDSDNDCSQEQQAYLNAQNALMNLNAQLLGLQDQLNNTYGNRTSYSYSTQSVAPENSVPNNSVQQEQNLLDRMSEMFNSR